jgi:hypothetical protein
MATAAVEEASRRAKTPRVHEHDWDPRHVSSHRIRDGVTEYILQSELVSYEKTLVNLAAKSGEIEYSGPDPHDASRCFVRWRDFPSQNFSTIGLKEVLRYNGKLVWTLTKAQARADGRWSHLAKNWPPNSCIAQFERFVLPRFESAQVESAYELITETDRAALEIEMSKLGGNERASNVIGCRKSESEKGGLEPRTDTTILQKGARPKIPMIKSAKGAHAISLMVAVLNADEPTRSAIRSLPEGEWGSFLHLTQRVAAGVEITIPPSDPEGTLSEAKMIYERALSGALKWTSSKSSSWEKILIPTKKEAPNLRIMIVTGSFAHPEGVEWSTWKGKGARRLRLLAVGADDEPGFWRNGVWILKWVWRHLKASQTTIKFRLEEGKSEAPLHKAKLLILEVGDKLTKNREGHLCPDCGEFPDPKSKEAVRCRRCAIVRSLSPTRLCAHCLIGLNTKERTIDCAWCGANYHARAQCSGNLTVEADKVVCPLCWPTLDFQEPARSTTRLQGGKCMKCNQHIANRDAGVVCRGRCSRSWCMNCDTSLHETCASCIKTTRRKEPKGSSPTAILSKTAIGRQRAVDLLNGIMKGLTSETPRDLAKLSERSAAFAQIIAKMASKQTTPNKPKRARPARHQTSPKPLEMPKRVPKKPCL